MTIQIFRPSSVSLSTVSEGIYRLFGQ
jgi:hypothetical protein